MFLFPNLEKRDGKLKQLQRRVTQVWEFTESGRVLDTSEWVHNAGVSQFED